LTSAPTYVLVTFMPAKVPAQADTQPSRSGRLLALVRKLITYGRELAATVRQRVAADPSFAGTSFGTADLAVIVARIARALLLAQALEARVLNRATAFDKGPRPRCARSAPRREPPASPPAATAEPPLAQLPTVGQIAAEIRRRPMGAVIADIYLNLGILPSHPLWREVQDAMREFGGSLAKLLKDMFDRTFGPIPSARSLRPPPAPALQSLTPSGTGPP
jgi:hypothetical protein